MKMIIVVLALVAAACAYEEPVQIIRSEFNQQPEGGYEYQYETANGILRSEIGEVKEALDEDKKPHTVVVVRGSYTYTDSEGKPETINYFADESGYHAEGPSVPKQNYRR